MRAPPFSLNLCATHVRALADLLDPEPKEGGLSFSPYVVENLSGVDFSVRHGDFSWGVCPGSQEKGILCVPLELQPSQFVEASPHPKFTLEIPGYGAVVVPLGRPHVRVARPHGRASRVGPETEAMIIRVMSEEGRRVARVESTVCVLVERFDIEPFPDFSAK